VAYIKNRRKNLYVPLEGERKEIALSLIANMIVTNEESQRGMWSRINEQAEYRLIPEMIHPSGMAFERTVLRALYTLHSQNMPASFDNILARVRTEHEGSEDKLMALIGYRTEPPDVSSLAFGIGDWIETQKMIIAAEAIVERMKSQEGSVTDKFNEAMQIMESIAPINTQIGSNTAADMFALWENVQHERERRLAAGLSVGPSFPWKSLNKKIANLKAGELCTIMAKSSHGKSVLAVIIAEYMAHVLGFDVVFFHLETSSVSIMDRIVSRKLMVQSGALRQPEVFKLSNKAHAAAYEAAKAEYLHLDETKGRIIDVPCAGIAMSGLRTECSKYLAQSQARGKELVGVVDYYQQVDWSELAKNKSEGHNAVANALKNMSETLASARNDFYLIAFAQYGVDTDYGDKKAGHGGQEIVQRSQVVIRVEREQATVDAPMIINKGGKAVQATDLIGVPIFHHQAGDISSDAYLNVTKANDDSQGPVAVKFINAYYEVLDHPQEKLMLDLYYQKGKPAEKEKPKK
jgi:replicative DNA helicase